jgi:hypothetical protein
MAYWCNKDVKEPSDWVFLGVEMGKGEGPIKTIGHPVWTKLGHCRCGFLFHFLNQKGIFILVFNLFLVG